MGAQTLRLGCHMPCQDVVLRAVLGNAIAMCASRSRENVGVWTFRHVCDLFARWLAS